MVRVLTALQVSELLNPDMLIEAVASAMVELSAGRASMPQRVAARVEEQGGFLAAMPAYLPRIGALSAKLLALFPKNARCGLPTHQAVIVAFDPVTAEPRAVMDGRVVTASRTAAGSALATRLLSRPESCVLAILGTGVQARSHVRFVPRVRPIKEIRIAGRSAAKAKALADEFGPSVRAVDSYEEAITGADIVCACTHSPRPVIRREWLAPGTHVNSVGFTSDGVELDDRTVADALVVVESRASALAPPPAGSNDLLWRIRDGVIKPDHVQTEIGELVADIRPGRSSDAQLTLYKSVGVAVQDAAAAALVLTVAEARGAGVEVEL